MTSWGRVSEGDWRKYAAAVAARPGVGTVDTSALVAQGVDPDVARVASYIFGADTTAWFEYAVSALNGQRPIDVAKQRYGTETLKALLMRVH